MVYLQGRRPYPFCHAKHQSNGLGGRVGKDIFIMTFCVTKWFQRKNIINKNKKLKLTHVCFPFHHGACTRRVFKFSVHNQYTKKAPTSNIYSSQYVENGREKNYLISVYRYLWICSHLVNKSLKRTNSHEIIRNNSHGNR